MLGFPWIWVGWTLTPGLLETSGRENLGAASSSWVVQAFQAREVAWEAEQSSPGGHEEEEPAVLHPHLHPTPLFPLPSFWTETR